MNEPETLSVPNGADVCGGALSGHVIESGIPIPERSKRGDVSRVLRAMKVGDSTVIPKDKATSWHSTARICNCKAAVRVISKTESRVWRVA